MSTAIQLQEVNFHNANLQIIDCNGKPFTPMKPIVSGMGLDWKTQSRKLTNQGAKYGCGHMTIPSNGGMQSMLCMPLTKLNGWLFSINPNKVRPDLREKIELYQEECFAALYDYWNKGKAERKISKKIEMKQPALALDVPSFNGEAVCCFRQISEYFEAPLKTLYNQFYKHKGKFVEHKDYYILTDMELIKFKHSAGEEYNIPQNISKFTVFTRSGVELLKNYIYTPKARKAFEQLEKSYFYQDKFSKTDDKYRKAVEKLNFPNSVKFIKVNQIDCWKEMSSIKKIFDVLENVGCDMTQPRSELNLYFGLISDIKRRLDCMFSKLPDLRKLKITATGKSGYKTEIAG